jgi:hypothetical protein
VKGQSVEVRRGHWTLPVTLAKHGDNNFRVIATRKGYVDSSTMANCCSFAAVPRAADAWLRYCSSH